MSPLNYTGLNVIIIKLNVSSFLIDKNDSYIDTLI